MKPFLPAAVNVRSELAERDVLALDGVALVDKLQPVQLEQRQRRVVPRNR